MEEFYRIYNLYPEQVNENVRTELTRLTGSENWNTAMTVLNEHPDMFQTAVDCIIYGG